MIPQRVDPQSTAEQLCAFADKWRIDVRLALGLHRMAQVFPHPLMMVSGFRTPAEQEALPDGAPVDVSTHTSCPATGADLQVVGWNKQNAPLEIRLVFAGTARAAGLRVGGGSKIDSDGVASDWNHVDLGRREK